jgi:transglutaminase-like putative cysteine protease
MSTVSKPRQLNLDELRRLKWLLGGALALVSLWTVFFLDMEAVGLVGVAAAMILGVLVWPQLPGRVPPLVWRLAVPAIILAVAADFYFTAETLPVLIRLAILLVLYRAVAYRRKREDLQLIVLGLFLIVVAGVLTVSLGFAFLLLLFTACALGFLFVINLIDASETDRTRTPEAETSWARLGWRKFFARLRTVADWRLLAFATALFTAVVVMSGLLFIIIPRFELATGFFLDKYITRKSRTAFTETVRFGEVSELVRDESVAMRVDLSDATGLRDVQDCYLRLVVLDEYTPQGFKVSAGLKGELLHSQIVTQRVRDRGAGRINHPVGGVWTFYIEPGVSRFLPLPGSYGILRLRDFLPLQTSGTHRLAALRTEPMTMTAFQLEDVELSQTVTDARFAQRLKTAREDPAWKVEPYKADPLLSLHAPEGQGNQAVLKRLVGEITGGARLPAGEFARRATNWLQTHHSYMLAVKLPKGEGKDDIVRWLDSSQPGFCEYFAAGFTVLARAAGHPARVIAGFHGGVLNGFENYYMVRNSEAHAWAEIYDGQSAWLRVDPLAGADTATGAGARAAETRAQAQDSSWSARLDSLQVLWYRRIVNFDARTQVQMFDQVKSYTVDSGQALRARLDEYFKRLKLWIVRPWDAARLGRLAGLLTAAAVAVWACWRLGQLSWLRWQVWRRPNEFDPVRREAGRWLTRLREPANDPAVASDVVVDLRRLRYGRRETWPDPRGVFKRARRVRKTAER